MPIPSPSVHASSDRERYPSQFIVGLQFASQHPHVIWSLNSDTNLVTTDTDDGHHHRRSDHDLLALLSRENKHEDISH
jgi:hypothetical protein